MKYPRNPFFRISAPSGSGKPSGYAVSVAKPVVDDSVNLTIHWAQGRKYYYQIVGAGGNALTGEGRVETSTMEVRGIDVSSLAQGVAQVYLMLENDDGQGPWVNTTFEKVQNNWLISSDTDLKWWKYDDVETAGSDVTQINEKNGSGDHIVSVGNPELVGNEIQYIGNEKGQALFSMTGNYAYAFVVARFRKAVAWQRYVTFGDVAISVAVGRLQLVRNNATDNLSIYDTNVKVTGTDFLADSDYHIFGFGVINQATFIERDTSRTNGVSIGMDLANAEGLSLGFNLSNTDMDIKEIVFANKELSTELYDRIIGRLAWDNGLVSNLPVDHPYKNEEP